MESGMESGNGRETPKEREPWHVWHDVKYLALQGRWEDVRLMMAGRPDCPMPYHDYTRTAFMHAVLAAQEAIANEMIRRGFSLSEDEGDSLLFQASMRDTPHALSLAGRLAVRGVLSAEQALYRLAGNGAPEKMDVLRQSGIDVLNGGNSFYLALMGSNLPMMSYLAEQGADLYRLSVVRALQGKMGELSSAARAHYADLVAADAAAARATGPATLYEIARAGLFAENARIRRFIPDDFLDNQNGKGMAIAVLAARGELNAVFDPALWIGRVGDAAALLRGLDEVGMYGAVDGQAFLSAVRRRTLVQGRGAGAKRGLRS